MNHYPEIERFAHRVASFLLVPAWGGLAYTYLHRPVEVPGTAIVLPEVGVLTVGILFISLLCFLTSIVSSRGENSFGAWGFVIICAIPFFGMVQLLDPSGMSGSVAR